MKSEEKRYASIPRAIGLFMVLKALFFKDSFKGIELPDGAFYDFIAFSEAAGYYLFLIIGFCLCFSQRFIFYWLALFACVFTLFGTVHYLPPGKENMIMTISMATAHIILCALLFWSMKMIKKILAAQQNKLKRSAPEKDS